MVTSQRCSSTQYWAPHYKGHKTWYRMMLLTLVVVLLAILTVHVCTDLGGVAESGESTDYCDFHRVIKEHRKDLVERTELEDQIASLQKEHDGERSELINEYRVKLIQVQNNASRFAASAAGQYLHTLSANSSSVVRSMATLDNELLVARDNGSTSLIERYDMKTFEFKGQVSIPGLDAVVSMTSCSSCECVYIADGISDTIFRLVVRDGGYHHTRWPAPFEVVSLSATSTSGVIVTYNEISETDEFSATGELVRTIQLQKDVNRPTQVIELDPGPRRLYLVVDWHGVVHSRVCIIANGGGEAVYCVLFETEQEMAVHVAVNGFVYVADLLVGRVELMTSTLSHVRDVITDLSWPYKIWLSSDLLFVAEIDESKIEDGSDSETEERISVWSIID